MRQPLRLRLPVVVGLWVGGWEVADRRADELVIE